MYHGFYFGRILRIVAGLGFAAAMGVSGAQAQSVTPDSVNPWGHIVDCLGVMLHDSQAHHDNCSPGQPGSNSTLANPVPSKPAGTTCVTIGGLPRPAVKRLELASLDDAIDGRSVDRYLGGTRIAEECGGGGCSSLDAPVFSTFSVASLEALPVPGGAGSRHGDPRMAADCCDGCCDDGGLTAPMFSPFGVASLDESIGVQHIEQIAPRPMVAVCD